MKYDHIIYFIELYRGEVYKNVTMSSINGPPNGRYYKHENSHKAYSSNGILIIVLITCKNPKRPYWW